MTRTVREVQLIMVIIFIIVIIPSPVALGVGSVALEAIYIEPFSQRLLRETPVPEMYHIQHPILIAILGSSH